MALHSHKLKSSWLVEVHYDDATQTLTVTTAEGTKHEHHVPPRIYQELKDAPSPGQYYNANLRNT